MSDKASIQRQLKIKSGAAKRLLKEHKSYILEAEQLKIKLDKFIADNAENWDIGNTYMALTELQVAAEKNPELVNDEEVLKTKDLLEEVSI
ncbi:hypothetical protein PHLCEN_2v2881 [Hermanssonia centrifuga]|uniref:Tubulin-specific chaperone A n=1 Tax=Hermanssonia centrifuga TaxID=98765 RepID=A0A2R6RI80_9APHY|nr:hypothetical protein PHLCEN_2v2881 [Hermanssonia centrifuga]